jgi:hypothetical protein
MDSLSPLSGEQSSSTSFSRSRVTMSEPVKLRNSCHTCAFSKLKCSGEKPACARCVKRGIDCEYVAAKRGGRKPSKKFSIDEPKGYEGLTTTTRTHLRDAYVPSRNVGDGVSPSHTAVTPFGRPTVAAKSLLALHSSSTTSEVNATAPHLHGTYALGSPLIHSDNITSTNFFEDLLSNPGLSSASTIADSDISDYFSAPHDTDLFDHDFMPVDLDNNAYTLERLTDSFAPIEDAVSDLFADFAPGSTPRATVKQSNDLWDFQTTPERPLLMHSCLIRALGLMEQLSHPTNTDASSSATSITCIVAHNGTIAEALGHMLECTCSQDEYLLAILSLILLKMLGMYTQGVRSQATSETAAAASFARTSERNEHEMCARKAAQLVLSELHRVRRLIEQVSAKFTLQLSTADRRDAPSPGVSAPAFSAALHDQFGASLMERLRVLSLEMIDCLRNS